MISTEKHPETHFLLDKPIGGVQSGNTVTVTQEEIRRVMGALGKIKSPAKAKAARKNGKKGGRPKQQKSAQR